MSGSLSDSPAQIVRELLIDLELGTDPDDSDTWPVYALREPGTPDNIITVVNTTSIRQGRSMVDGEVYERSGVQITVRNNDPTAAYAKANAIAIALDGVRLVTTHVGSNAYTVYAVSREEVLDIGKEVETSKRNLFTINATVALRQA